MNATLFFAGVSSSLRRVPSRLQVLEQLRARVEARPARDARHLAGVAAAHAGLKLPARRLFCLPFAQRLRDSSGRAAGLLPRGGDVR